MTAPTLVSTNLVTNPGYEVGTACFSTNDGSKYPLTADTTAPIAGTRSAMTTRTATSPNNTASSCYFSPAPGQKFQVTAGVPVTWAISCKSDTDGMKFNGWINWYDATNVSLGKSATVISPALAPGEVYRLVVKGTPPVNATQSWAALSAGVPGVPDAVGQRCWLDQQTFENADTDGSYFDGDTPDTATFVYDWTGAPNASTSTKSSAPPPPVVQLPGDITATLYVDGVRVADGTPGDDETAPTALSGLSVTWGRATTVDQPEPSTASFDVMDPAGGSSFLGLLYVGAAVEVRSAADVDAPATLPINADTSFESTAPGGVPPNWTPDVSTTAAVTTAEAATGAQSLQLSTAQPLPSMSAYLRPAPRSTDPSAWDHLPAMHTGEEWVITASVLAPAGTRITLQPRAFDNPDATASVSPSPGIQGTSNGDWFTLQCTVTVAAQYDGYWLGAQFFISAATWADLPGAWTDLPGSWADLGTVYLDDVEILAPASAGTVRRDVVVFSGRVTDVDAGWDDAVGSVVCRVVAADFTADLSNRVVGDVPWPVQTVSARCAAILSAAGTDVPISIAPTLATVKMSYLDVDAQPALALLQDVATSVDGVLWSATHADVGPYLYLADPAVLSALYRLAPDDAGVVTIVPQLAADNVIALDACELLRDPVTFRQAASDVSTRVVLSWQEQTNNDQGQPAPTERSVTLVDAAAETALGVRRVAVSTLLTTDVDAADVAERILGRLRRQSWRASGLVLESAWADPSQVGAVMDLLDGTRRLAAPILLSNVPDWAPTGGTIPLYLQGGRYHYTDGAWTLELVTASAQSQGTSLSWNDLDPAWAWDDLDPAITWTDLIGVTT